MIVVGRSVSQQYYRGRGVRSTPHGRRPIRMSSIKCRGSYRSPNDQDLTFETYDGIRDPY